MKYRNTFASLALSAVSCAVFAQSHNDIHVIRQAGEVTIGVRSSSIPVSYKLPSGQYVGLAVEICERAAHALKAQIPNLKVSYVEVTSANRFEYLQSGKIDMECGSTSNTGERRKGYDFSAPYFFSHITGLVHASSNMFTFYDLSEDNSFVFTKGTNSKKVLMTNGFKVGFIVDAPNTIKMEGSDHQDSFKLFKQKSNAVYFNDDMLLVGLAGADATPKDYRLLKGAASVEPYGVVMRKNSNLTPVVNRIIIQSMRSGEFSQLYSKWFQSPIAPNQVNLNLEMSATLRDTVRFPSLEVGN